MSLEKKYVMLFLLSLRRLRINAQEHILAVGTHDKSCIILSCICVNFQQLWLNNNSNKNDGNHN